MDRRFAAAIAVAHVGAVVAVRGALAVHALLGFGVGRRHDDEARHPPVFAAGALAGGAPGFAVGLPVVGDGVERRDRARNHAPALRAREFCRRAVGAGDRDVDRRMRLLQRLRHEADAELGQDRLLDLHVPELALDVVGRVLRPDAQDHVDRFHEGALARGRVDLEQLEIGGEPAGADAEQEAAAAHVVELRGLAGDDRRMMVRQVDDRGAEREVLGLRHEAGEEHQRRGERLGGGGEMLAHPELVVAELVGQDRLGGVLGQRVGQRAAGRMHRHHEHSQTHARRVLCAFLCSARPAV